MPKDQYYESTRAEYNNIETAVWHETIMRQDPKRYTPEVGLEAGEAGHLHLVLHPNLPLEPEPFVGGRPVGGLLVTLAENEGVLGKGIR